MFVSYALVLFAVIPLTEHLLMGNPHHLMSQAVLDTFPPIKLIIFSTIFSIPLVFIKRAILEYIRNKNQESVQLRQVNN